MEETNQPVNQTNIEKILQSNVHTGSGDILNVEKGILITNLKEALAVLRKLAPTEQTEAVEKIINVLKQLSRHQKVAGELKQVHHLLHNLETPLSLFVSQIRTSIIQGETINFYSVRENWGSLVRPQILYVSYFVSQMETSEERRFEATKKWTVDLILWQQGIEESLKEKNISDIYEVSGNMLDSCREHLFRIDRQLLDAINVLEQLSRAILERIDNG